MAAGCRNVYAPTCIKLPPQKPSLWRFTVFKSYLLSPCIAQSTAAGSSHVLSGIRGSSGRRLLDADVSASSTAAGTHSASGNLTTAASYRAGPNAAGIGVALIDGGAAADNGIASVSAKGESAPMVRASARFTQKQCMRIQAVDISVAGQILLPRVSICMICVICIMWSRPDLVSSCKQAC